MSLNKNFEEIKEKYFHKWIKNNDNKIFIKHIYENFYDPPHWKIYVFLGRDENNNFIKFCCETKDLEKIEVV